jgi:two-component system, cell cycle sensor histidine kinase and response regulator CckA
VTGADQGRVGRGTLPVQGYRAVFEASGTGLAVNELDGRFVAANPALCRMLGLTEQELRSRDVASITHPDHRAETASLARQLIADELPSFTYEKRYLASDGREVWARVTAALIRDADGNPRYTTATLEDLTATRQSSRSLGLTQSLLRVAGDLASVGGWAIELPDREILWSDEIYRILDAPAGLTTLDAGFALYSEDDLPRLRDAIDACADHGTSFDLELALTTFSGRPIVARLVGEAELGPDGAIRRVVGAFQDISELVRARARAEDVETRLTDALESMTDAVLLLDDQWRFVYLNPRAEELLRRDAHGLLGRVVWEEFPEATETELFTAYRRAVASGAPQTVEGEYYAPLETWFQVKAYPSAQGLAVYFRDVSDEHVRREELLAREAKLAEQAALLDETQDAILVRDLSGIVTYWNAGAQRLYGWSRPEAVGRRFGELVDEDREVVADATRQVLTRGTWSGELTHVGRDGGERLVATRWTLLRDLEGRPRSILVTDTDVTDRRRIEDQLLRAQRMESIGTLAGGIAHDLNNVLAPILMSIELLASDEADPRKLELLRTVEAATHRGADMVRQVLSFARGVSGEEVELDVAHLLDDVLRIVTETFPRHIRVAVEVPDDLPAVRGDATQLHQVLMNLLVNARDAVRDGGTIRCRVTSVQLDEQYTAVTPDVVPGPYVTIEVADDGHGMAPAVVDRIFEPFFTTKAQGEGTGLGLSTSMAIVQGHGGHIRAYSEPGRGTTLRVHLPVSASTAAAVLTETGPSQRPGAGERVMVVDDESAVLEITRQTLEASGYEVAVARDGAEAVAIFAADPERVDLVLTDVMMPVMDGPATIRALRSIRPEVRIIAASGLDANGDVGRSAAADVQRFLPKPYTADTLLEAVGAVLDGAPPSGELRGRHHPVDGPASEASHHRRG